MVASVGKWAAFSLRCTLDASRRAISSSKSTWRNSACPSRPDLASQRRVSKVSSMPVSRKERSAGASEVAGAAGPLIAPRFR
jgi:hypothetical protein